mmetsp:Transcript_3641/g.9985  ORF Transcript_3641/g.9985 Transcript_3641/m.9985 type:complete len:339 (+) Transcript_3641:308-1324(+)
MMKAEGLRASWIGSFKASRCCSGDNLRSMLEAWVSRAYFEMSASISGFAVMLPPPKPGGRPGAPRPRAPRAPGGAPRRMASTSLMREITTEEGLRVPATGPRSMTRRWSCGGSCRSRTAASPSTPPACRNCSSSVDEASGTTTGGPAKMALCGVGTPLAGAGAMGRSQAKQGALEGAEVGMGAPVASALAMAIAVGEGEDGEEDEEDEDSLPPDEAPSPAASAGPLLGASASCASLPGAGFGSSRQGGDLPGLSLPLLPELFFCFFALSSSGAFCSSCLAFFSRCLSSRRFSNRCSRCFSRSFSRSFSRCLLSFCFSRCFSFFLSCSPDLSLSGSLSC